MDDKLALTLFIEAQQVGNLYVSLWTYTPTTYALAIMCANRFAHTEDTISHKRKQ